MKYIQIHPKKTNALHIVLWNFSIFKVFTHENQVDDNLPILSKRKSLCVINYHKFSLFIDLETIIISISTQLIQRHCRCCSLSVHNNFHICARILLSLHFFMSTQLFHSISIGVILLNIKVYMCRNSLIYSYFSPQSNINILLYQTTDLIYYNNPKFKAKRIYILK